MKKYKILHICVNYKNDQETAGFLRNCLQLQDSDNVHFVLVNNSALSEQDLAFKGLLEDSSRVTLLNAPLNPGYFGAAELALKHLPNEAFDFVILSNSDLEILNENFYEFLGRFAVDGDVGALAPSILSQVTGAESNPLYKNRPSAYKMRVLKNIYSNYYLAWVYHFGAWLKGFAPWTHQEAMSSGKNIYAAHGCFLILTKNYFLKGGGFTYPVRLYGEEIFLAERLQAMGLKTLTISELKISHREQGTIVGGWGPKILGRQTWLFKKESSQYLHEMFCK